MIRIVFPYILFVSLVSLAGRRAERLSPLRDSRLHAGAAQPVDHRRRDFPCPLLRSADQGAGVGRVHRRRCAARLQIRAARAPRHAAAPPARLARRGRTPRAAGDGAGADRRVGGADLGALQHAARRTPRRRPDFLDHLRRPAHGVSHRAARGRARHGAAAVAGQASQRRQSRAVLGAARLGVAPCFRPGAAGCPRAVAPGRCRWSRRSTSTASSRQRRVADAQSRCWATAWACSRSSWSRFSRPGFYARQNHAHAGEDRVSVTVFVTQVAAMS